MEHDTLASPHVSKEMRSTYLNRRREDVARCRIALKEKDWTVLRRTGHKIKGNAETFGFASLAPLGANLETCAETEEESRARVLLDQLDRVVEDEDAAAPETMSRP